MIVKTLSENDFINEFKSYSEGYANKFSIEGLRALYNYIDDMSCDMRDNVIELDVVALCCEYTEYDNALECAQQYGYEEVVDLEPHGSVDLIEVNELEQAQALEWLQDRTQVIEVGNGKIIIANF